MAYCVKCGAKVQDGAKFCPECGASIPEGRRKIKIESSILIQTRIPGITVTRAEDIKKEQQNGYQHSGPGGNQQHYQYKEEKI